MAFYSLLCIKRTDEVSSKSQKSIPFIDDAYGKTLVIWKVSLLLARGRSPRSSEELFALQELFIDDGSGKPSGNVPCAKLWQLHNFAKSEVSL